MCSLCILSCELSSACIVQLVQCVVLVSCMLLEIGTDPLVVSDIVFLLL